MTEFYKNILASSLKTLLSSPHLPLAVAWLSGRTGDINKELKQTIIGEIAAFTVSGNPEVVPELETHCLGHTAEILRLLAGGTVRDIEFVKTHAERRAEQRFPLEATLHAYRCGHKIYARWIREAILTSLQSTENVQQLMAAVADFAIDYTDVISNIATSTYLSHTCLMADVAGDQRAQLLDILLDGYDESDGRVAQVLRGAGYLDRRQSFCVVLAQSVDPAEVLNPARAPPGRCD